MAEYVLQSDGDTGKKYRDAVLYRQTSDGSPLEVTFNGETPVASNVLVIPVDAAFGGVANIVGRETTGADFAAYTRQFLVENTASVVTLIASATLGTDLGSNGGSPPAGWGGPTISVSPLTDSLKIAVTGQAATNINWVAKVDVAETD